MGQSSKALWTKFDRHFSEKGIGAWEGRLLRCLLNIPWNSRLMILFDKSAKEGFLNDNIVAVLEGEREVGTYSRQAFLILLVWSWGGHFFNGNQIFKHSPFPGDTLYSKNKPPCATTSNSNHLPWELNHQKFPCQTNTYCTVGNSYKQPPSVSDSDHILGLTNFPLFLTFCRWPLCAWSDLYVHCIYYNRGQNS